MPTGNPIPDVDAVPGNALHVALVGPAEPREFIPWLAPEATPPRGMGGVPVNELAKELLRLGHRVSLVTASTDVDTVWSSAGPQFEILVVPYRPRARARALDFFAAERRGIADALRGTSPDVVHAHWTYEFALGAIEANVAPLLTTAHDAPLSILRQLPDAYRLIRLLMAWQARRSIREMTGVSPYTASRWAKEMAYRRPITVIPNPVPMMGRPAVPRSNVPTILSVGNGSRLKNVWALLRAFSILRESVQAAQLRLVGPGLGTAEALATRARRAGLAQSVTFVGKVERTTLQEEFSKATVYCHPSLEETQGIVLLEALAVGLPVIAGRKSGGVPWTLFDGKAGRLVDVRRPSAIAGALRDTIANPLSTTQPGFPVARELHARYSSTAVASQYLTEYRRIVRGPGSAGVD